MMKAIVFGGSGFLGSHVADALTQEGYDVSIFDSRRSPYITDKQTMILGDILDINKVEDAVRGCQVVYNFAGIADIDEAMQKPLDAVKQNILGNTIILDSCVKAGCKRFVFASSLYVYSKSGAFYRSTKQASELLIENYHEVFGLDYTILRYGSLYGPRATEKNYINDIITQALTRGKIARDGDGEEIREYIHVLDAARCSVEVLSEDFENEYVIITGNQQMKVRDLFIMINEILGNNIEIEFKATRLSSHYEITPYSFAPKLAKRMVSKTYLDLGQGILQHINDIHNKLNPVISYDGVIVKKNKKSNAKGVK